MKNYIKYIVILIYILAIALISVLIMNAKLESAKTSSYGEEKICIGREQNYSERSETYIDGIPITVGPFYSSTRAPTIVEIINYGIKSNIFLIVFNMLIAIIIYLIMYFRKIIKINIQSISLMALVIILPIITNIIQLFSMYSKLAIEVVH